MPKGNSRWARRRLNRVKETVFIAGAEARLEAEARFKARIEPKAKGRNRDTTEASRDLFDLDVLSMTPKNKFLQCPEW